MKIEIDKFYKTRDGHKAKIYDIKDQDGYPVLGAVLLSYHKWVVRSWTKEGTYLNDRSVSDNDIVSEWEETKPKSKLLAYVMATGEVKFQTSERSVNWEFYGAKRAPHLDFPEDKNE